MPFFIGHLKNNNGIKLISASILNLIIFIYYLPMKPWVCVCSCRFCFCETENERACIYKCEAYWSWDIFCDYNLYMCTNFAIQTSGRQKSSQTPRRKNFLLLTHSIRNASNKDMFPRVDSSNTSQLSFPSSLTFFFFKNLDPLHILKFSVYLVKYDPCLDP